MLQFDTISCFISLCTCIVVLPGPVWTPAAPVVKSCHILTIMFGAVQRTVTLPSTVADGDILFLFTT